MIRKVLELVNKIPIEERRKLRGLAFIVEKNMFQISEEGQFIAGQYFANNSIVFYENFIYTDEDLKNVFIHELCHHFGMDEEQVRNYMNKK